MKGEFVMKKGGKISAKTYKTNNIFISFLKWDGGNIGNIKLTKNNNLTYSKQN